MSLLNYLALLIFIYSFYFFTFILISNKMKKDRIKREKVLESQHAIENDKETEPDPESLEIIEKIDKMLEVREKRGFYISCVCILLMLILIVMSMFNDFKIDFNEYLHFLYYIIPFVLLKTIQDAYEYFKKKYLKNIS